MSGQWAEENERLFNGTPFTVEKVLPWAGLELPLD